MNLDKLQVKIQVDVILSLMCVVPVDHSLFINCGGTKLEHDGNEYEEDLTEGGAAHFVSSAEKWAYSSTGVYMGNSDAPYRATFANETKPQFYQSARLSPLSLKYYGLCLREGSYKVQLHFAEIMYSDDQTFTSLGRRIFDVSIQVSESRSTSLEGYLARMPPSTFSNWQVTP